MTTRCPRAWEVEATRDGRLTGDARASFEAHLARCESCTEDAGALEGLARGLRAIPSGADRGGDVAMRRLRNRVLDAVDAEQTGRERGWLATSRRARAFAFACAFACVCVLAGIFGVASWRATAGGEAPRALALAPVSSAPSAPVETTLEVAADEGARFSRTTEQEVDRFDLLEGTLRLRVRRGLGRRVVVNVPDGVIEDIGTVFEVTVVEGHTESVRVHEGRVVVSLVGAAPVRVDAGGVWRREVVAVLVDGKSGGKAKANANANAEANANANANAKADANANANANAKANAKADANAKAEDGAYLEVLRLWREGREADGRAAARAYLQAFPRGFRRAEMERLAEAAVPAAGH